MESGAAEKQRLETAGKVYYKNDVLHPEVLEAPKPTRRNEGLSGDRRRFFAKGKKTT
jgi:hypothetical protein